MVEWVRFVPHSVRHRLRCGARIIWDRILLRQREMSCKLGAAMIVSYSLMRKYEITQHKPLKFVNCLPSFKISEISIKFKDQNRLK